MEAASPQGCSGGGRPRSSWAGACPGGGGGGGGKVHAAASRLAACCNVLWRLQHPVRVRSWGNLGPARRSVCGSQAARPGGCWHLASHLQLRVQPQVSGAGDITAFVYRPAAAGRKRGRSLPREGTLSAPRHRRRTPTWPPPHPRPAPSPPPSHPRPDPIFSTAPCPCRVPDPTPQSVTRLHPTTPDLSPEPPRDSPLDPAPPGHSPAPPPPHRPPPRPPHPFQPFPIRQMGAQPNPHPGLQPGPAPPPSRDPRGPPPSARPWAHFQKDFLEPPARSVEVSPAAAPPATPSPHHVSADPPPGPERAGLARHFVIGNWCVYPGALGG